MRRLFSRKKDPIQPPPGPNAVDPPARGSESPALLRAAKTGVTFINSASSAFPPLQSVAGGLLYFINNHGTWLKNKADGARLLERLNDLEKLLLENGPSEVDRQFHAKLASIETALTELRNKSSLKQYIGAQDNSDTLTAIVADIQDVVIDYQTSMQKEILLRSSRLMDSDDFRIIHTLPRAQDAHHLAEKHDSCLKGTRIDMLSSLDIWAHDSSALSVYWLNGHAGSGKSTITQSFCHQAFADGILGASFFCSRASDMRSNLRMIFPTLSFQLACKFPDFSSRLIKTLKSRPDVGQESLSNQLVSLLIEPLEAISLSTVLVIDALDECKDSEPASAILSLLARHIHRIPTVKWFITGRPEPPIRAGFRLAALRPITEIFILHDITSASIDHDIALFLSTRLSNGVKDRSDLDLPTLWPDHEDIQTLTTKCGQLFIFAATAVTYILSPYHEPSDRLAELCSSASSTSEHGRLGLDQLYTTVLENGYGEASPVHHERLKAVISSIVLAFDPLTLDTLSTLLDVKLTTITSLLRLLHAVLRVPQNNDSTLTLYHKSFFDYITDDNRCTNLAFHVNPSVQHSIFAEHCLRHMTTHLKRNICLLPRYALNSTLDLLERRRRIGGAMEYACSFWVAHLSAAHILPGNFDLGLLENFITRHLMHWMEALSLLDNFRAVINSLHQLGNLLRSLVDVPNMDKELITILMQWTFDARKLASESREAAQVAACHLYHSALPLAPANSLLRISHSADLQREVKITYGNFPTWPSSEMSIPLDADSSDSEVVFSNSGDMLAISGSQNTRIIDVASGHDLHFFPAPKFDGFRGHRPSLGVSFSPDDKQIAMPKGNNLTEIWDLQTGESNRIIPAGCSANSRFPSYFPVCNQAFSPSGKYLAVGEKDALSIWNVSTGELRERRADLLPYWLLWLQEEPAQILVQHCTDSVQILNFEDGSSKVFDPKSKPSDYPSFWVRYNSRPALHGVAASVKYGLVACSLGKHLYFLDIKSLDVVLALSFTAPMSRTVRPAFSEIHPLVFCSGYLLDITDIQKPRSFSIENAFPQVAFCPTRDVLATFRGSLIQIWPTQEEALRQLDFPILDQYSRKLSVSPDGNAILSITEMPNALKLLMDEGGMVAEESITIPHQGKVLRQTNTLDISMMGNGQLLPKSLIDISMLDHGLEPGAIDMGFHTRRHSLQTYTWSSHILTNHFRFATPSAKTGVVVSFEIVGERTSGDANILITMYSIDRQVDLGQRIWEAINLEDEFRNEAWISMDLAAGVLTIYNSLGVFGIWKTVAEEDDVLKEKFTFERVSEDDLPTLEERLEEKFNNMNSWAYPVIANDDGWIVNHHGERILWLPYRVQASAEFRLKWRWARKRLIVASDNRSTSGKPLILDFSDVDVTIPNAAQVCETFEWSRLVISGLHQVEA